jgi:mono/diheme cytochrome c family protein
MVACISALVGAFALNGLAQSQSVSEGVYSAAQAARGQEIYRSKCVECQGATLEGVSGPPLVGNSFISNWSGRPLADLVSKVQTTMPFGKGGTLSRPQTVDVAAYILQSGKFPAGRAELSDDRLAQISFPGTRAASASAAAAISAGLTLPPPAGNLAELMRAIAFPNSNIIFNVQNVDPAIATKREPGAKFNTVEWGSGIYPGWQAVELAAIAIIETAPLFLTPGRRCQNGRPAPVDRADWKKYTAELMEVGKVAQRAAQMQNREAFDEISEKLADACAACHGVYRRDGRGQVRCQ